MADMFPQPPLAPTVSAEARAALAPLLAMISQPMPEMTVAQQREMANVMMRTVLNTRTGRYQVTVTPGTVGGVSVQMVSKSGKINDDGPLLLNFHGGGFTLDSGSLVESMPIAAITGIPVVSVLYRLAPEHPYPAAVDDALAVYRAALQTRSPKQIAIFGTSAGAVLCGQLLARLKREGLPLPAGAGIFSGSGDMALSSDIEGYLPPLLPNKPLTEVVAPYVGATDRRDPLMSPLYGPLDDMPPALLMSSTRDILLSQTARFHLALRAAGNKADLFVYEGMPHAFWAYADCPETDAAFKEQATFLAQCLGKAIQA